MTRKLALLFRANETEPDRRFTTIPAPFDPRVPARKGGVVLAQARCGDTVAPLLRSAAAANPELADELNAMIAQEAANLAEAERIAREGPSAEVPEATAAAEEPVAEPPLAEENPAPARRRRR